MQYRYLDTTTMADTTATNTNTTTISEKKRLTKDGLAMRDRRRLVISVDILKSESQS